MTANFKYCSRSATNGQLKRQGAQPGIKKEAGQHCEILRPLTISLPGFQG
jgi:hypothetical protein